MIAAFPNSPFNFGAPPAPPPGGDPDFASVVLLLHCDGMDGSTTFTDSSNSAHTITAVGNTQISTTAPKFGTGAALFDGVADSLSAPASANWAFGTADFTVEYWLKSSSSSNQQYFALPVTNGWSILLYGGLIYWQSIYEVTNLYNRTPTFLDGNWHHIAHCRSGTSHRFFVDGAQVGATVTDSTNYAISGTALAIGSAAGRHYNGRFDDIRITKGVARYTADFTPPTAAFPDS